MTSWTPGQLRAIGAADELDIAALRPDGTLRPYTTIWVVRAGDVLYIRSYRGQDGTWYQAVQRRPEGRIRVGGAEYEATFEHLADIDQDAIDAAYRSKYGRYGRSYLDPMLAPGARATTLRLNAKCRSSAATDHAPGTTCTRRGSTDSTSERTHHARSHPPRPPRHPRRGPR